MSPALVLPPCPAKPMSQLSRAEIRSLAHSIGAFRREASYKFFYLLPLVARHEIFFEDGCSDIYEWATKFGGLGPNEVDRVLKLFGSLGKFECLWGLLLEGVGMSKLERVAPHATPESAEALATKAKLLTKPELEEYLRAHGKKKRPKAKAMPSSVQEPAPDSGQEHNAEAAPMRFITSMLPAVDEGAEDFGAKTDSGPAALEETLAPGAPAKVRLSLELDAVGEKRVRELQAMFKRVHGRPIALGELFALLAQQAIGRGEVPSSAAPEGEASGEDSPEVEVPPVTPARTFKARLIEVVVSIAETGWRFIRTALGWVPVAAGAVAGFLAQGQPIPLENLRIAAEAAASKASGTRHIPAAVERYLRVRSGGYCEVGDCGRAMVDIHHRRRYALDPSHHPDDLVAVCEVHHGLAHKGAVQDESVDPQSWRATALTEMRDFGAVDRTYSSVSQPRRAAAAVENAPAADPREASV